MSVESPRVASFVPSATEWVYGLGLEERLVGVTDACSVPERARRDKPVVVRSALTSSGSAADVHARVADAARVHASLYRLDADALRRARPDVLVSQSLCDVCAASNHEVEEAARILGYRPRVVALAPVRLSDALADARVVAEAAGAPERGVALHRALTERVDAVRAVVAGRTRPRVAVLEWTDPPMRCGHWFPDVVEAAGGVEVLGEAGGKSVTCAWSDVSRAAADVIVVAPCGFPLPRAEEEARAVAKRFPGARVVAVDADRFLSRSGPSLADAIEILAHVLHPDACGRDPDPSAWTRIA